MTDSLTIPTGQRGPVDTEKRDAIVAAAREHFSRYGYSKTTVSDLAKAIGYSKGYIYKFFESKQAIGEAICTACLSEVMDAVHKSVTPATTATDKLRRLIKEIVEQSASLFFENRKLYDIAAASCEEDWQSAKNYLADVENLLRAIILQGREAGEFERKTPLDEVSRSIMYAIQPFMHPLMLQYNLDLLPDAPNEVISLILRSLAP